MKKGGNKKWAHKRGEMKKGNKKGFLEKWGRCVRCEIAEPDHTRDIAACNLTPKRGKKIENK